MSVPVVYVAGTGRSGSTLVAQLLEQRTDAVHVGELRYLWDRGLRANQLCECRHPFRECPFWTAVLAAAYPDAAAAAATIDRLAPRVDRVRNTLRPAPARDRAAYASVLAPLYAAIVAVAGVSTVVDSSKDPSYLYALGALPGLDVRTLHLVRDPRAVAYSWTRRRRRPEVTDRVEYMRTLAPRRAARNWLLYNALAERFGRGRTYVRLRYEDFAAAPDHTLAEIARGLGMTSVSLTPRTGHSISGNPLRFEPGPTVVRLDDQWRAGFPARDRRLVTAATLPLLLRYGYPVRGR